MVNYFFFFLLENKTSLKTECLINTLSCQEHMGSRSKGITIIECICTMLLVLIIYLYSI